ncbi:MAG TPA: ELWxxDGT repeat protein [Thermoanaerobaculia bacterium]|nr:ELWxxDGT repeat protein [Thermoanaerobaculia bacterium]
MRFHSVLPLTFGLLASLPAQAQPAFLVRDINPSQPVVTAWTGFAPSAAVGNLFFGVADDGLHGEEVWRSDGTPGGTYLLKDVCPGDCSSSPGSLTASNGRLFFVAADPQHGMQLWKSDGTPEGTSVLKDLAPSTSWWSGSFSLLDAGGKLFFAAAPFYQFQDLWVTDGTVQGTHRVGDVAPGYAYLSRLLAAGNGQVLFAASSGTDGLEPWVTDGTNAGTHRVADVNSGFADSLLSYDQSPSGKDAVAAPWGGFVFVADDGVHGRELWRTDGTMAGTTLIKDIAPGATGSSPYALTVLNGAVIFAATDPAHGTEIWRTDGTAAGTMLLGDVWPGSGSSNPLELTAVGGQVFFRASDGSFGSGLWVTDGTPAGTHLVLESAFSVWDRREGFTSLGGRLLFYSSGSFWLSDGTVAGTLQFGPFSSGWPVPDFIYVDGAYAMAGGRLFFRASIGQEIWVTDGTPSGSHRVKQVLAQTSSFPVFDAYFLGYDVLADFGGNLFFQATDGQAGYELWRSDGTAAGTWQVKDFTGDPYSSYPSQLTAVNGRLAFSANGRLGLSDGTPAGTRIVPGSSAVEIAALGNRAFFLSQPDNGPKGLWKTDGTEAGTVPVAPLDYLATPSQMTASGGKLFFSAYDGTDFNLWVSDGTAAGTFNIDPLSGLEPQNLTDVGGTLFFTSFWYSSQGLWKSNGTKAGTVQVKYISTSGWGPFPVLPGGVVLFQGNDFQGNGGSTGLELWRSDGTTAGTVLVKDIFPGPQTSAIWSMIAAGGKAFLVADDGVHGHELWVSDGTAAGTHLVKDVVPGPDSSLPSNLTAVGSVVVFTAFDPEHGMEAWRSDGTVLGTRRLADIAPGPLSSSPLGYTVSGPNLYFTADDNTTGFELWAVPLTSVFSTFADVPTDYWAWSFVETLAAAGITNGCGEGLYCPASLVSRGEMAVFLERGIHGSQFTPPPATGTVFTDVPASYWSADWIEQLAADGITRGCGSGQFCPGSAVSRAEMAVFLLRARHGSSYTPPPVAATRFTDVPPDYWAAAWIEQLATEGITGGCGSGNYCPDSAVWRDQMAVFLTRTFHLPSP